MKNKKKIILIVVAIIVVISLIVIGINVVNNISNNQMIKETEEKIKQINSEELREKIIERLKNTEIDIQNESISTQFIFNDKGYTTLFITNGKDKFELPLFKIQSDNNSHFQNINYLNNTGGIPGKIRSIVYNAIKDTFKIDYNIEMVVSGNSKYNTHFNSFGDRLHDIVEITCSNNEFGGIVYKEIIDSIDSISVENDMQALRLFEGNKDRKIIFTNFGLIYDTNTIDEKFEQQNNENESKYTKEQVISMLTTQKDKNGMLFIIGIGDYRLRKELNYIGENEIYIASYNYRVYDDVINFYIIIPQANTQYGMGFYDISGYQASYTVTDETVKYFSNLEENNTEKRIDEIFEINTEHTISYFTYVPSDALNNCMSQTQDRISKILTYDPTGKRQEQEAEESKQELIKRIKDNVEKYNFNHYNDPDYEITDEQMEDILKYFNYKIENYTTLGYENYVTEHNWFSVDPGPDDGKDHSKASKYEQQPSQTSDDNSYQETTEIQNNNQETNKTYNKYESTTEAEKGSNTNVVETKKISFTVNVKNIWDKYCEKNDYKQSSNQIAVTGRIYIDGIMQYYDAIQTTEKNWSKYFEVYGSGEKNIKIELDGIDMYSTTINLDTLQNGQTIKIGE